MNFEKVCFFVYTLRHFYVEISIVPSRLYGEGFSFINGSWHQVVDLIGVIAPTIDDFPSAQKKLR